MCVLAFITLVQGSGAESGLTLFQPLVYNFSVSLFNGADIYDCHAYSDTIHAYNVTAVHDNQKCTWLAILVNLPLGILWYMTVSSW